VATAAPAIGGRPSRAPWWLDRATVGLPAAATLRAGHPCPSLRAASFSTAKSYLFFAHRGLDNGVHFRRLANRKTTK
jgi:hypothetical protein